MIDFHADVATALLSEILTNNASGAIMYPIAAIAGDKLKIEVRAGAFDGFTEALSIYKCFIFSLQNLIISFALLITTAHSHVHCHHVGSISRFHQPILVPNKHDGVCSWKLQVRLGIVNTRV